MSDRFLTWMYYECGLHAIDAQRLLTINERNALVSSWIKAGCPYPTGY